jgi:hypothetical protein
VKYGKPIRQRDTDSDVARYMQLVQSKRGVEDAGERKRGMTVLLTDYDGVRTCLRTAATNGPIFHPPGDM